MRAKLKCTPSLYASRSRTVQLVPPEEFSQLVEDARTGWLTPQVASWFLNRRYDPFQHDVGLRKIGNTIRDRRSAFMKIVPSIRAHMFKQLDTTQMLNYNYRVLLSVKVRCVLLSCSNLLVLHTITLVLCTYFRFC